MYQLTIAWISCGFIMAQPPIVPDLSTPIHKGYGYCHPLHFLGGGRVSGSGCYHSNTRFLHLEFVDALQP